MDTNSLDVLRGTVRDVPDFPTPGIIFKDITPVLLDPVTWAMAMQALVETLRGEKVDKVIGIDARGFIFAAVIADRLQAGFVPLRKKGKLPFRTRGLSYDLEYGSASLEIHADALRPGERVALVDDVLATGGTAAAALHLVKESGAVIVAASFLIELGFLHGRSRLPSDVRVESVLAYP